jgi:hypothetical protein
MVSWRPLLQENRQAYLDRAHEALQYRGRNGTDQGV